MITSILKNQLNLHRAKIYQTRKQITIDLIKKETARYFNQPIEVFDDKSQTRAIVEPRQIAMHLAKDLTNYSYAKIGKEIGNKHKSTVFEANKVIIGLIETDYEIDFKVNQIKKRIINY
jgi:chromosomal replication initiator protein